MDAQIFQRNTFIKGKRSVIVQPTLEKQIKTRKSEFDVDFETIRNCQES
jgi:hypothetical protein